jgi:hypothetical protein
MKRPDCIICLIVWISGLACCAGGEASDERVKPGTTFHVDFAQLGTTWENQPSRMGIHIPKDYTLDRTFPLLVWYGGGPGSDSPGPAQEIAGASGFVCVGVPYLMDDKTHKGGWSSTPWSYYKTMFDELEKIVPNINPDQRICGGFSSGGAAIMRLIGEPTGAFNKYFYAFMPGGAGWPMGGLASLKGRPMFAFIGNKDSAPKLGGYQSIEKEGKAAGVDLKYLEFEGGHEMPTAHYPEMREWMMQKVVLRDLPKLQAAMKTDLNAKRYGKAFRSAREISLITTAKMPAHLEALETIARSKPFGAAEGKKLLAGNALLAEQQQFVRDWKGCDFTTPVEDQCNAIAEEQLKKILSTVPVSTAFLKKYISMWDGFKINRQAKEAYNKLADDALTKIRDTPGGTTKCQNLQSFIAQWNPAPAAGEAKQLLEDLAKQELETIKAIKAKATMRAKLGDFVRSYAGTTTELEARQILDQR